MDSHFSRDAHGRSFLVGRSRTVIFGTMVMDGHFSRAAHKRSFLVGR